MPVRTPALAALELRGHVCVSCVDVCERSCEDECCVRRSAGGRYFTEGALRAALANGSLTADTVSTMATHVKQLKHWTPYTVATAKI